MGANPIPSIAIENKKHILSFNVSLKQFFLSKMTCNTMINMYKQINPSAM